MGSEGEEAAKEDDEEVAQDAADAPETAQDDPYCADLGLLSAAEASVQESADEAVEGAASGDPTDIVEALIEDEWYKAKVLERNGNTVKVRFEVDDSVIEVDSSSVRPLPQKEAAEESKASEQEKAGDEEEEKTPLSPEKDAKEAKPSPPDKEATAEDAQTSPKEAASSAAGSSSGKPQSLRCVFSRMELHRIKDITGCTVDIKEDVSELTFNGGSVEGQKRARQLATLMELEYKDSGGLLPSQLLSIAGNDLSILRVQGSDNAIEESLLGKIERDCGVYIAKLQMDSDAASSGAFPSGAPVEVQHAGSWSKATAIRMDEDKLCSILDLDDSQVLTPLSDVRARGGANGAAEPTIGRLFGIIGSAERRISAQMRIYTAMGNKSSSMLESLFPATKLTAVRQIGDFGLSTRLLEAEEAAWLASSSSHSAAFRKKVARCSGCSPSFAGNLVLLAGKDADRAYASTLLSTELAVHANPSQDTLPGTLHRVIEDADLVEALEKRPEDAREEVEEEARVVIYVLERSNPDDAAVEEEAEPEADFDADEKEDQSEVKAGQEIEALFEGEWMKGEVTKIAEDGKVMIRFEQDTAEVPVEPSEVRKPKPAPAEAKGEIFKKDDKVKVMCEGFWYSGTCLESETDGKVKVQIEDDDSTLLVEREKVQKTAGSSAKNVGGKVIAIIGRSDAILDAAEAKVRKFLTTPLRNWPSKLNKDLDQDGQKGTKAPASNGAARKGDEGDDSEDDWGSWGAGATKASSSRAAPGEGAAGSKPPARRVELKAEAFKRGDKVEAKFEGYWYDAVCLMDEDSSWDKVKVLFDIDQSKVDVPVADVRRRTASTSSTAKAAGGGGGGQAYSSRGKGGGRQANSEPDFPFSKGDAVEARFEGYWYLGRLAEDAFKGKVRVHFDIDNSKVLLSVKEVRAPPSKGGSKRNTSQDAHSGSSWPAKRSRQEEPAPKYRAGEIVEAKFQDYWYKAEVEADERQGKVKVHFEIDDSHVTVPVADVRPFKGGKEPEPMWRRGQVVEAFFEGHWYQATCLTDEKKGKVRVHFEIDDSKLEVSSDKVRELPNSKKAAGRAYNRPQRSNSGAPATTRMRIASHKDMSRGHKEERHLISWWTSMANGVEDGMSSAHGRESSRATRGSKAEPARLSASTGPRRPAPNVAAKHHDRDSRRSDQSRNRSPKGRQARHADADPSPELSSPRRAGGRAKPSMQRTIRVIGLTHLKRDVEKLTKAFKVVGRIESAKFVTSNEATVTFDSESACKEAATTYHGGEMMGHTIHVYRCGDRSTGKRERSVSAKETASSRTRGERRRRET